MLMIRLPLELTAFVERKMATMKLLLLLFVKTQNGVSVDDILMFRASIERDKANKSMRRLIKT